MLRPKEPSPVVVDRFPLTVQDQRRLALLLGLEELPPRCTALLGDLLAVHLKAARALREPTQEIRTRPGVAAVIAKARKALRPFTEIDTGIDADTLQSLKPHVDAFLAAADKRLAELGAMRRVYWYRQPLYLTCPRLRVIFEEFAVPDIRSERRHLRRFAFDALTAATIELRSIDERHLDRLDEFLDAPLEPLG